ncbi:MAG TPA: LacI family transcriptional regulator [Clostridiales bacterium]|nr:LacI family transcriptional regulator [Clostridiales bacterium]
MKASIKVISEMTGLSPATVSNALNRKRGVSKETVEKVLHAAETLGYSNKTHISKIKFVIYKKNGLIINDSPFFPAVIEGVERQAKSLQYETVFCNLNCDTSDCQEQIKMILEDTSSAVILLGTEMMEPDFKLFEHSQCPLILLDGWSETITFDSVLISNTDSACKAVEYLIEKGHKKIGYLKGKYRIKAFTYRSIGYKRAMNHHGLAVEPKYSITLGTTIDSAYRDMAAHLENTQDLPTAFFADNDVIALGAMRALQEKGYRVPHDISIIGFDDIPFGEISSPRLSTIHVFKQEMGEIAVRRLIDHIKLGSKVKTKIQVCTEFVERDSVRNLNLE